MARDYVSPNRKPAPGPASLPGWVWLGAGLSMGLAIAALVYIGRPAAPMPMATPAAQTAPPPKKPKIEVEPAKDSEYSFYELLREQRVDVPRDEEEESSPRKAEIPDPKPPAVSRPAPTAPQKTTVPATGAYVIVLGSFREASNADEHRASLALSGIESRIEKIRKADGQMLYQVRVGPEKNEASAKARLARIRSQGFDGRVLPLN